MANYCKGQAYLQWSTYVGYNQKNARWFKGTGRETTPIGGCLNGIIQYVRLKYGLMP